MTFQIISDLLQTPDLQVERGNAVAFITVFTVIVIYALAIGRNIYLAWQGKKTGE